jgi:hypothetical protein
VRRLRPVSTTLPTGLQKCVRFSSCLSLSRSVGKIMQLPPCRSAHSWRAVAIACSTAVFRWQTRTNVQLFFSSARMEHAPGRMSVARCANGRIALEHEFIVRPPNAPILAYNSHYRNFFLIGYFKVLFFTHPHCPRLAAPAPPCDESRRRLNVDHPRLCQTQHRHYRAPLGRAYPRSRRNTKNGSLN